ncbi:hypothetical protein MPTK1_4g22660 [Marchantia polymorpha subsp. ruderalis]|nr:hypothetical protein MARPO_0020s0036 [Marchantia polymorpha]BBN09786.1 hypothetical protein Mp_4g22660 [Marchantia polymorpha subsp. ruderalis]|eukprot:PTQ44368.1 hypothetical protein MARPO_0020s0036 [Marchantia polymorpha]
MACGVLQCVVRSLAVAALVLASTSFAEAGVLFSTLDESINVAVEIQGQNVTEGPVNRVAKVGDDRLVVSWNLNSSLMGLGVDKNYVSLKLRLCFAPISQLERGWRKTNDDLHRDKTCTIVIANQKYTTDGNSTVWRIPKNVPGATYFVRAYATDERGQQLAYGQSTDQLKTSNLITIIPISGRHVTIDIASGVFSVFSIASLIAFLASEFAQTSNR